VFWKRKRSDAPNSASYVLAREHMVQQQLASRDIHDTRVLEAMRVVPREEFVPDEVRTCAYDDRALAIGYDQTISQPYTVAFMLQALKLSGDENVLEIGTGSGYGVAVLSCLVRQVHTTERIVELATSAKARLVRLRYANVEVHMGDGTQGLAEHGPFDAIIVTAGARQLPPAYGEQLAKGGRILIPIGDHSQTQTMRLYSRQDDEWQIEDMGGFRFVPLICDESD
jgi:protein-L-isoaspartate(D-aspartate) O-methyltransferase